MNRIYLMGALALFGCSAASDPSIDQTSSAVINGTDDPQFSAAFSEAVISDGEVQTDGICSATLIGPHWLLTAAHCVGYIETTKDDCGARVSEPFPTSMVKFANSPIAPTDAAGFPYAVKAIYLFPDATTTLCANDIALVRLESDVTGVTPILPDLDAAPEKGDMLQVIGFGATCPPNEGECSSSWGTRRRSKPLPVRRTATEEYPRDLAVAVGSFGKGDSGAGAFTQDGSRVRAVASFAMSDGDHLVSTFGAKKWFAEVAATDSAASGTPTETWGQKPAEPAAAAPVQNTTPAPTSSCSAAPVAPGQTPELPTVVALALGAMAAISRRRKRSAGATFSR